MQIAKRAENPEARIAELEDKNEILCKALEHNLDRAKWINQRFKMPDGLVEEIDEISRISKIALENNLK